MAEDEAKFRAATVDAPIASALLATPVREVGRQIAAMLRAVNATTSEQDPGYERAAAVAAQFSAWMVAVRALQSKDGVDLTPELGTILSSRRYARTAT